MLCLLQCTLTISHLKFKEVIFPHTVTTIDIIKLGGVRAQFCAQRHDRIPFHSLWKLKSPGSGIFSK